jgi:hypothetical protein
MGGKKRKKGGDVEVDLLLLLLLLEEMEFQHREGCCGTLNLIFSTTVSFERFW